MSPGTPKTPGTPSTDVETVASPIPPRNDRADADSSAQRKRPRLDSGDQAHRSISEDSPGALGSPRTPPQSIAGSAALLDGTPSRVTINVRPPVLGTALVEPTEHDGKPNQLIEAPDTPPSPVELIPNGSVRDEAAGESSAQSSPRIEATGPEDIVAAPSPITVDPVNDSELSRMYMRNFPFWGHDESLEDTLDRIQKYLIDNDNGKSPDVLRLVVAWMQEYLTLTERFRGRWYNLCVEYREFWDAIPLFVSSVLAKSQASIYLQRQAREGFNGQDLASDLVDRFLKAYAQLTARMVLIDIRTLQENVHESSAQPDLLSTGYLKCLSRAVRTEENELLLKALRTPETPVSSVLHNCVDMVFSQLPEGFDSLTRYTLDLLDRSALEDEAILRCFETAGAYILDWSRRIHETEPDAATLQKARSAIAEYFETVNERIQRLVRKQSPSLRLENLRSIHRSLGSLLNDSICKLSVPFANRVPRDYEPVPDTTDPDYRAFLITASWKMMVFKECIMHGHMDARIFGVYEMNELLLQAYNLYYKGGTLEKPLDDILQFLVDFLHQHRIIHYLIGVGSHRQLVSRAKNIIVFLGATKQYTNSDTDTVWNAIRTGQDPRVVEVVVELAKELLGWCSQPQVIHYFNKFLELPISRLNVALRDLCRCIIEKLIDLSKREGAPAWLHMKLYALFIRLFQEVYADQDLAVVEKREIILFAQTQLRTLIHAQLPDVNRMEILSNCLQEISSASLKACGSACVICIILGSEFGNDELPQLQMDFNFAEEVIEDITRLSTMEKRLQINLADFQETITDRLTLMVKIIVTTPSALTEELTEKMWTSLVGKHALNDSCRNAAWGMLGHAISLCGPDQRALVDQILYEHFPTLEPSFFTSEVLAFADRITEYEIRMAKADGSAAPASPLHCGDLFWSIALKTTSSQLAATAIDRLVHHQLHGPEILQSQGDDTISDVHGAFIERAVQNLISAANECRRVNPIASFEQPPATGNAKHRVLTSLTILRKFVEQARCKLAASPRADSVKSYGASGMPGDRVKICFQAHAAGKSFEKTHFEIGDLATVKDLAHVLSAKTGFNKLNVIVGGRKMDLSGQADMTLRDIPFLFNGLVLVQKLPSDKVEGVALPHKHVHPLDGEVMKHFHALYELLGLDFELGHGIYGFLSSFPPHEDVVAQVCNLDPTDNFTLPVSSTFKCLYCIYALQTNVAQVLQGGLSSFDLLAHGVQSVSSAILLLDPAKNSILSHETLVVLNGLVAALVTFLKEPVPADISARYFSQPEALIDRLTAFITCAIDQESPLDFLRPVEYCFTAILEVLLRNQELRAHITSRSDHASLIKMLLLESRYVMIREVTKRALESFLSALRLLPDEEVDRLHMFLWSSLHSWIPYACQQPYLTEQFFALTVGVFRNLSHRNRTALPLAEYAMQWSRLLSEHHHREFVGRPATNYVVLGLASLLRDCVIKGEADSISVHVPEEMLAKLFRNLLFPDIVRETRIPAENGRVPILDAKTRSRLYSFLLSGGMDMQKLQGLVGLCGRLFDVGPTSAAWTWGLAQPSPESGYMDPNRSFDGAYAIRSSTGYPGLKNLSNTCYMNALLTQLFMNSEFRNFVLSLDVADSAGSQTLVYEVQRIFVYLQESWLHAIDPENVAEAVITYDRAPIDVTIQMDVDEFYNLLFDRLENQLPDAETKWKLRRFYGGRIVQQIKSKDCPHISERTEPYQAIQCEILGKSTLEESLKAYVEGEIMEGDNKYSCGSCGSYVNAVKRACFKDVPDNLIFHLKRFDYDLATGMRSKINDYFQFPAEIDMGPFMIDYLQDTSIPAKSDLFTLVGVLVHTGQAESGHYYSYVCDRSSGADVWLEFNDSEVTYFDWKAMQSASFGGILDRYDHEPFMKPWNAYMLFYRRKKDLPQRAPQASDIQLSLDLTNEIRIENEKFLRKYAMFDNEHGFFVTALLEKYVCLKNNAACSDGHHQEKEMIRFALLYMDEVFARQKDSRHAPSVLQAINRIIEGCGDCAKALLMWFVSYPDSFQGLLLKCPMEKERRAVSELVLQAVRTVRNLATSTDLTHSGGGDGRSPNPTAGLDSIALLCRALTGMLLSLHQHWRAWDEFFGLLSELAAMGSFERSQLRSLGVLRHVLQILAVYSSRQCARMWPQFQPLLKAMDRRHFSLRKLIVLTERLIREAELLSEASSSDEESPNNKAAAGLDVDETSVLSMRTSRDGNASLAVLEAVFSLTGAESALSEQFVATILHTSIGEQHLPNIVQAILNGSHVEPAGNSEPWLRGAVGFIENSDSPRYIRAIINQFVHDARSLEDSGGMVYLNFFERVRRAHNPSLMAHDPKIFKMLTLQGLPKYGATLLLYRRGEVRAKAHEFIHTVLRECGNIDDDEFATQTRRYTLELCNQCIGLIEEYERKNFQIDVRRIDMMQQMLRYFITDVLAAEGADMEDELVSDMITRVQGALDTLEAIASSSPEELASGEEEDSDSGVTEYSRGGTIG